MSLPSIQSAGIVAGVQLAAGKGGESDARATEASNQAATAEKPGGKNADSPAVDAGEQTGDRHGNGRQMLDTFEKHDDPDSPQDGDDAADSSTPRDAADSESGDSPSRTGDATDQPPPHLDLMA
ncbi:hypothetical protein [Crateriforma conspicua]|uniref:Uncharacterized protein n=1 Tax=Crateriforma conspicua TaxID=2527996 RepID=A0A5C6FU66_9PLAN|nr:hypothetical protein [Crateriforma conspicua]TWU65896.1 hypothetical protein V7x_14500 [Crateriforma conspicua]